MTVTLTSRALTTLATMKEELGIPADDTSKDDLLKRRINAASDAIVNFCSRRFDYEPEVTEKLAGQGTSLLILSRYPIVEITEVKINDAAVNDWSFEDKDAGLLYRQAGWPWAVALRGDLVRDPLPGTERQNIEVKYSAGYVTPQQATNGNGLERSLPFDLEQYCIDQATALYLQGGEDKTVVAEGLMSARYTYDRSSGLLQHVAEGLRQGGHVRAV